MVALRKYMRILARSTWKCTHEEDTARFNDIKLWYAVLYRAEDGADSKGTNGRVERICLDIQSQSICQGLSDGKNWLQGMERVIVP